MTRHAGYQRRQMTRGAMRRWSDAPRAARSSIVAAIIALCLLALAACDEATLPTSAPSPTASPANLARTPLDLEEMVRDSGAIVIGTITGEADPSLVPRLTLGGPSTPFAADRFRNFVFEVQESYVPGVEPADTIVVKTANGLQSLRTESDLVRVQDIPGIEVGAELLLFLDQVGRRLQQNEAFAAPEGFPGSSYYSLPSSRRDSDGTMTVGYFVRAGDTWVYPETGSTISQEEFLHAAADNASVVRPECFGFSAPATDYIFVAPLASLVEKSDLILKGRIDGSSADLNTDTVTIEVLDVLSGEIEGGTVTFNQAHWIYTPGFEACDYYFFLRDAGGAFADEQGPFYDLAAGPQAVFVVHEGAVQQTRGWPLDGVYRGMPEEDFKNAVVRAAEQVGR